MADFDLNESIKLDGENYVNWTFKLMIVVEAYNLWKIVKGDELSFLLFQEEERMKNYDLD
jgi:hypothetical protein